jgi:radical SAM superfamily enzyme YgiQ (UPF0313 family)
MSTISAESRVADTIALPLNTDVVLIGFQNHENLGLGYLASNLRRHGRTVSILDFKADFKTTLAAIKTLNPSVVGFSLIFQFYVRQFSALVNHLRAHGVECHFTMGGHFPSLSFEEVFRLIPQLDSVVRFEGETTLVQLVDAIRSGADWRSIRGVAYRKGGEIVANELQPLIRDLDELSYPDRVGRPHALLGRRIALLLASRGCARTCSFCSIHVFYRSAPGKVVRTRRPTEVVKEMLWLHRERQISIFSFQDDDFPLFGPVWRQWTREFLGELRRSGLAERVIWKISCRADSVEEELFSEMKEAGLYFVYMGLESGSDDGLETLNKHMTVQQNLRAVEILKRLGITLEYGFMLFEPSTTFSTVTTNVGFLREVSGDGSTAASFCRMVPYDGTPIRETLARSGRLRGDVCSPDYDFLDPKVTEFFELLTGLHEPIGWMSGKIGVSEQLKMALHEAAVIDRLFPPMPDFPEYFGILQAIVRDANATLFELIDDIAAFVSEGRPHGWSQERLATAGVGLLRRFRNERDSFISANQGTLMRALEESRFEALVPAQ